MLTWNRGEVTVSMFALMVEGKSIFRSMGEKRGSLFFKEALELPAVYAKEAVRLCLEKMEENTDGIIERLRESKLSA